MQVNYGTTTVIVLHKYTFGKLEILIVCHAETMWKWRKFMHFSGLPSFRVPNCFWSFYTACQQTQFTIIMCFCRVMSTIYSVIYDLKNIFQDNSWNELVHRNMQSTCSKCAEESSFGIEKVLENMPNVIYVITKALLRFHFLWKMHKQTLLNRN